MPPTSNPDGNVSHKCAAIHEDVHNMVGVAIPAKIMPRFELSLLGDLDLMMLHFVQEQVKFRKFHRHFAAASQLEEEGSAGVAASPTTAKNEDIVAAATMALQRHRVFENLKASSELSEIGLDALLEKEKDMLDAWLYKFMQFQLHFFSEVGYQIMNLQKPSKDLAVQLDKRNLNPAKSTKILGEVDPETIVATPGWEGKEGSETQKGSKGWFGMSSSGKGKGADEHDEHGWRQGMFRRRNVDFFKSRGVARVDDNEDDSTMSPDISTHSASNSRSVSRRSSGGRLASFEAFNANELMGGLKRIFSKDKKAAAIGELESQNSLLGTPKEETGHHFPRTPEGRASISQCGQMEGVASAQELATSRANDYFGRMKSGEEWITFPADKTEQTSQESSEINVEFDASSFT